MNGLYYIRNLSNKSQEELAKYLGISKQAVSAWEKGIKPMTKTRKEDLSKYFGIPEEYFKEALSDIEQLKIHTIKLELEIDANIVEYTKNIFNRTTNEFEEVTQIHIPHSLVDEMDFSNKRIEKLKLLKRIDSDIIESGDVETLSEITNYMDDKIKTYNKCADIVENNKISNEMLRTILNIVDRVFDKNQNVDNLKLHKFENELAKILINFKTEEEEELKMWVE